MAGSSEFNLTEFVQNVCRDITERLPQFSQIDVRRIAFGFSYARNASRYGVWASVTPLRFANGAIEEVRRGRVVRISPLFAPDGTAYLYIFRISFPRMWDLSFEEKISTLTHELHHISPEFNGDIRRFHGRCYAHGSNAKAYDAYVQALAERWLSLGPPEELLAPLRWTSRELLKRCQVSGLRISRPRIIPVSDPPRRS